MSKAIEKAIQAENWKEARQLILKKLRVNPESHWLLTRLGLTFYEERAYSVALKYETKALELNPLCPLVLWDYAGSLQMLGRHREALRAYKRITGRSLGSLADDECGEGRARARGLVVDCLYREALSHEKLGQHRLAIRAIRRHLKLRGPGCHSIYGAREIKRELARLTAR